MATKTTPKPTCRKQQSLRSQFQGLNPTIVIVAGNPEVRVVLRVMSAIVVALWSSG